MVVYFLSISQQMFTEHLLCAGTSAVNGKTKVLALMEPMFSMNVTDTEQMKDTRCTDGQ